MNPAFDGVALEAQLAAMPWPCALGFASACATRLLWGYARFVETTGTGDIDGMRRALRLAWDAAEAATLPDAALERSLRQRCAAAAPDATVPSPATVHSRQASAAVVSVLAYLEHPDAATLVVPAQLATEAVALSLSRTGHADAPSRFREHQLMQQELGRQYRDLFALTTEGAEQLVRLRASALVESTLGARGGVGRLAWDEATVPTIALDLQGAADEWRSDFTEIDVERFGDRAESVRLCVNLVLPGGDALEVDAYDLELLAMSYSALPFHDPARADDRYGVDQLLAAEVQIEAGLATVSQELTRWGHDPAIVTFATPFDAYAAGWCRFMRAVLAELARLEPHVPALDDAVAEVVRARAGHSEQA